VPQLIYLHDLAKSHRVTHGDIIETYPQIHSTCKYRYSVDGRSYEHSGRSCGNERVGQSVTVYFSPSDPGNSVNADPASLFWNDLTPFALALVTFPILGAIAALSRAPRSSKGTT
jgi:Protein of unknown function (DUF3592)